MSRYDIFARIRSLMPYMDGGSLDNTSDILRKTSRENEYFARATPRQIEYLGFLCDRAEERRLAGFGRFNFGTAIDRLVNKGLFGKAVQRRVSLRHIVQFRHKFFNEQTNEIDSELKQTIVKSGMSSGKRRGYHERYAGRGAGQKRTKRSQEWIKERYEESFKRFETYLTLANEVANGSDPTT